MKKITTVLVALLACVALAAPAIGEVGYIAEAADSAEMLWIKYTGDQTTPQVTVTTSTIVLTDNDTQDDTLTLTTESYTLSEVAAWVNGRTNDSGTVIWEAKLRAGLGTDIVTNNFVIAAAATTVAKRTWEPHVLWDTTAVERFDVVPTALNSREYSNGYIIDRIVGEPGGTGNVTVYIYEDDVVIWQNTITSPYYVPAGDLSAANSTNTAVNVVTLDIPVGIPTFEGKRYHVRATRTVGTTGVLGVITK